MEGKIMLVDGNSMINRAFYALPVLTASDGTYTNAVAGFFNIFFKLYDEERPEYCAVAFDVHAQTFRHVCYKGYKGTRKPMPEELRPQIPLLQELLGKMNIAVRTAEGFEADDLLGTLAVQAEAAGLSAVIVTGDRDLLQIASESIKIRIPKTRMGKTEVENYFAADVQEKLGVSPAEFIQVKALMGDTSDNIPGVPGIGEKTAYKLIQDYKTVENTIAHASEVKPKRASENLVMYQEQARLSLMLATIDTKAPVVLDAEAMRLGDMFPPDAQAELRRLELRALLSRAKTVYGAQATAPAAEGKFTVIREEAEVKALFAKLAKQPAASYRFVYENNRLARAAFCCANRDAVCIQLTEALDEAAFAALAKPFFESETKKLACDAKRDMHFLHTYGVELNALTFDALLAGYILNSMKDDAFADMARVYLKEEYDESAAKPRPVVKKQLTLMDLLEGGTEDEDDEADNAISAGEHAARQADILFRAAPLMQKALETNGQTWLYNEVELPLVHVLKDMELYGVRADKAALEAYGERLQAVIDTLTAQIYEAADEEFNINSPKQLGVILFEKLNLPGGKKTKTGWSTAADVLNGVRGLHPIVDDVLAYRTHAKLKSTYADGLVAVMDENEMIHSTFNQTVTATGRISSTEPNLQNIPIRTALGRELRGVFKPSGAAFVYMDADYSQIELRVLAHMSGDEAFIQAFRENRDIHRATAAQVLHIPYEDVTAEQRGRAKAVNFGIVYGIGAYSLSIDLGISVREAAAYIESYFEKYPKVKAYLDGSINSARDKGFAETIFGRRRNVPELSSGDFNTRAFGERVAMNMPVQGTAADIIKIAMVRTHARLKREGLRSRLVLQVHDELLLEAHREETEAVRQILLDEMENAVSLDVPLSIDIHTGETWLEAK